MALRVHLVLFVWLIVITAGCSVQEKTVSQNRPDAEYSAIYILHADADYLYHNEEGEPLQADREALKKAQAVAENAERGEIFIFHQRPEQQLLRLFPKKDRRMYRYVNGELVQEMKYSPEDSAPLATEAALYRANSSLPGSHRPSKRVLLYYGHEIPSRSQNHYHRSRPDARFGLTDFADGLAQFGSSHSGQPLFDLIVLSTCNNGTPGMINHLKDRAAYILASPQNLHLSHIDSDSLLALETNPRISIAELAGKMAARTYERMSGTIQTEVTLSLYDMSEVGRYVEEIAQHISDKNPGLENRHAGTGDNIDCAAVLSGKQLVTKGVQTWFKPPAFGRQAGTDSHSGWGCPPASQ
ncbi:MAG: clostripain-related cysteine peptidase [Balneolaceae bacterium]